jgi:hypothetical protein
LLAELKASSSPFVTFLSSSGDCTSVSRGISIVILINVLAGGTVVVGIVVGGKGVVTTLVVGMTTVVVLGDMTVLVVWLETEERVLDGDEYTLDELIT